MRNLIRKFRLWLSRKRWAKPEYTADINEIKEREVQTIKKILEKYPNATVLASREVLTRLGKSAASTVIDLDKAIGKLKDVSESQNKEVENLLKNISAYAETVPYACSDILGGFANWLAKGKCDNKPLEEYWKEYINGLWKKYCKTYS